MRRTATGCLCATALALTASAPAAVASVTADSTPPRITAVTVNPDDVLLPASKSARKTSSFTISMRVADPSGVDTVVAGLYSPKGGSGHAYRLTRTSGSAANGLWKVVVRIANPQPTGQWRLQAFAVDNKQNSTDPGQSYGEYRVRDETHFAHFDATEPTPVGEKVEFTGFLQRFDPKNGWTGYAGQPVTVEFKPTGGKEFRTVQTTRTGKDGSVAGTTAVAKGPGTWRMAYAGTDQRGPSTSREDEVGLPPVDKQPEPAVPPGVRCEDKCPSPTPTPTSAGKRATPAPTASPSPTAVGKRATASPTRSPEPTPSPTRTPSTGPYRR